MISNPTISGATFEPLRALVSCCDGKSLVLYASWAILFDMAEVCGAGRDLDDGGPPPPDADGLWIWEGKMVWRRGSTSYYGDADDEVDYKGEYRRATPEEAAKLVAGELLWPKDDPDEGPDEAPNAL
jgi:hypothetical protein